jgi:hypothetical protein
VLRFLLRVKNRRAGTTVSMSAFPSKTDIVRKQGLRLLCANSRLVRCSNDATRARLTNILCTGTERGYDVKSAMDVLDGVTSLLFGSEPSGGK